jgi:predicted RNA binding protein YcfA (HicA-like mRNA interferase family)
MSKRDTFRRRDVITKMEEYGAFFVEEGGKHSIYENPRTGARLIVPRHANLKGGLARALIKLAKQ